MGDMRQVTDLTAAIAIEAAEGERANEFGVSV